MNRLFASASLVALALVAAPVAAQTSSADQDAPSASSGSVASAAEVRQAQNTLRQMGIYKGDLDGATGPQMRQALRQYQQQKGLPQTGELDRQTLAQLNIGRSTAGSGSTTPPPAAKSPSGGQGTR